MEQRFKAFVVEDNEWYQKLLKHALELNPDHSIDVFTTGKEALAAMSDQVDLVTVDYRLPDMKGDALLEQLKKQWPDTEVIVISEQEDIEVAVELLKSGAFDYIVKGKNIKQQLLRGVELIKKHRSMQDRIETLESEVQQKYDHASLLVGESEVMRKVHALIEKAIKTDINVVITGETGTGKELVAKTIHFNSKKSKGPFEAVNLSAVPSELIESELFGHVKGAFTGASADRIGVFERATGGTLLLDEIAELDLSLQAKLLRVLQEREFMKVGGEKVQSIDCRILVATNKDLAEEVKAGRFRQDLFYRFFGVTVALPPLRARGQDIVILAKRFAEDYAKNNSLPPKALSQDAVKALMGYAFPGNVRELRSVIELGVTLSEGDTITSDHIHFPDLAFSERLLSEERTMREYEYMILDHYLTQYDQDVLAVAGILDIGKSTIYRMLKERNG